jgi:hypothetical protein
MMMIAHADNIVDVEGDESMRSFPVLPLDEPCHMAALWFVLFVIHHLFLMCIFHSKNQKKRHSSKDFWNQILAKLEVMKEICKDRCCPKRRARYWKCSRRCARRRRRQESKRRNDDDDHDLTFELTNDSSTKATDEEESLPCPIETFVRLHLPPPLPFVRRRRRRAPSDRTCVYEDPSSSHVEETESSNTAASTKGENVHETNSDSTNDDSERSSPLKTSAPSTPRRPVAMLMDQVRMQQWDAIMIRQEPIRRKEAKHRDLDGLYPLHWACSGGPPVAVVEALLETYPPAARKTDRDRSTPLTLLVTTQQVRL